VSKLFSSKNKLDYMETDLSPIVGIVVKDKVKNTILNSYVLLNSQNKEIILQLLKSNIVDLKKFVDNNSFGDILILAQRVGK